MKTFLFVWNPKRWVWQALEKSIAQITINGQTTEDWSVVSHKKIRPGDRAFLIRLGEEPKGIMGSGFVASAPFITNHWSGGTKLTHKVLIDFEVLLNPESDPLLSLDLLRHGNLVKFNWTPQSSGIEIPSEFTYELEAIWFDFLTNDLSNGSFLLDDYSDEKNYKEGTPNQVIATRYERNPYARRACIAYHGLSCKVCNFNFEKVYGELGKNFIHVHHVRQLASIKEEYSIDPVKDLVPVCPNCHSMLHKRDTPYSVEELKEILIHNKQTITS